MYTAASMLSQSRSTSSFDSQRMLQTQKEPDLTKQEIKIIVVPIIKTLFSHSFTPFSSDDCYNGVRPIFVLQLTPDVLDKIDILPNYFRRIGYLQEPVNLFSIQQKAMAAKYLFLTQFESDVIKCFNQAIEYYEDNDFAKREICRFWRAFKYVWGPVLNRYQMKFQTIGDRIASIVDMEQAMEIA